MQIQLYSPLTGEKRKPYSASSDAQIDNLIKQSESCQLLLNKTTLQQRFLWINNLKTIVLEQKDNLVRTVHEEVGKPVSDIEYEINDIIESVDIFKKSFQDFITKKTFDNTEIFPHTKLSFMYKNRGVIGVITPWNFPFWMPMTFIIPALISGCSVVFKPSEYAYKTGLSIQNLIDSSKFPKHTVQTVVGTGRVGERIVKDSRIQHIFFVGSSISGKAVGQSRIRAKSKGFTLEMGGNSAAIITENADLDNAIPAVFWNATYFAGQVCTGIKRVIVHDSIFAKVKDAFINKANKINCSNYLVSKIGPIITKDYIQTIEFRIACAIKAGNTLYTGGKRIISDSLPKKYKNGNFFPITVIEITNRNIDLVKLETFAPIIPLIRYRDLNEAIEIANETEYDLSANIFSENNKQIQYLTSRINAGMIFINDSEIAYPGGNYWKGGGQSYLSTTSDNKIHAMYEKTIIWNKKSSIKRDYWFCV